MASCRSSSLRQSFPSVFHNVSVVLNAGGCDAGPCARPAHERENGRPGFLFSTILSRPFRFRSPAPSSRRCYSGDPTKESPEHVARVVECRGNLWRETGSRQSPDLSSSCWRRVHAPPFAMDALQRDHLTGDEPGNASLQRCSHISLAPRPSLGSPLASLQGCWRRTVSEQSRMSTRQQATAKPDEPRKGGLVVLPSRIGMDTPQS